ncbi:insect intestinal lipase 6 [Danaus plexippus plexippus]|uniref:Insect intestinal lipase 6 n=1 Tax=Danaus plexippus plexippus TaxID=278856 RepID=A0A212FLK0_DANPL|nr:insect intestinal lipase 6 [Danaus plexippus plexippus]
MYFYNSVCAESTIPVVPGDNSHYVEGVSRYIWMPDGEGNPLLVDLHAPVPVDFLLTRKGKDNKYFLYTRQNRKHYQVLVKGDVKSISNSNYRDDRPTKIITHGWMSNGKTKWIKQLKDAFLDDADVNVIILDWSSAAIGLYTSAVHAVPDVGVHVARLLDFVFDTAGGNWDNVHLVGHSLGAHVMGNAGRAASSRPMRVTDLDEARRNECTGPPFVMGNSELSKRG